jgi:predicted ribosome quality control (RQC) complex YloA/Tae2 family protein
VLRLKEFTSFDVAAVVRELKEAILGSRVSNIYQLNSSTLLFKLHKPDSPPFGLVLESARRLHLTSYMVEKPLVPPAFCMALRKYLRVSWLKSVEQYEFERVIVFCFKAKTGELKLILELFGDGNVILLDEKDKILHALTYKRMRDRNVLREEAFTFAPSGGRNPLKIKKEELLEELVAFGDVEIVRALARFLSIGGVYAEEALLKAGISKTKSCSALSRSEVDVLYDALYSLLSTVLKGKLEPCIILDENGGFIDVVPFRLNRYEHFKSQPYASFNEALDEFYVRVLALEKATAGSEIDKLVNEAQRLKRIVAIQEKTLLETEAEIIKYKTIGDTIYAHSSEFQTLLDRFLAVRKGGKEWNAIASKVLAEKRSGLKPSVFFESFDSKGLIVNVYVDSLRFSLNLRGRLFDNAAQFYEHSKRAKQRLAGVKAALEDTRKKLVETEDRIKKAQSLQHAKPAEAMEELVERRIKRKEWFEKFRWFISSDDFLVVAGKDAVSNEVLIKKYTSADDIVFHADITGAPFVIVKAHEKTPSEQCIRETAEFAVAFSRAWREGFTSADVYWVKPDQLSKGGSSGEYVPHGAFVVSGKRNWLHGVPLKLAVGIAVKDGDISYIGGPVDAVKYKSNAYVVIAPGDQSGKELSKHIFKVLATKSPKELQESVLKTPVEKTREFIPYNKGRISGD